MFTKTLLALGGVAILAPAAFAEDPPNPDPMAPADPTMMPDPVPPPVEPTYAANDRTYTTTTTETPRDDLLGKYGFALTAGGGVSGFTSETARDATNTGGGWDVRASFGTKMPVSAELSYLGSAQQINALGLDNNAVLVGNGVQADLRLNLIANAPFQPFVYAGAAWRRYDVTNTNTNTSDINDSDNVVEFPVGVGMAYRFDRFIIDARGEFRAATNQDLMPSLTNDGSVTDNQASLHRWGVNANVGYEF